MARAPGRVVDSLRLPRPKTTGVIAIALAAGFITWLVLRGGESSTPTVAPTTAATTTTSGPLGPVVLTEAQVRSISAGFGQRVYWLGTQPGRRFELKRDDRGQVFLRYLPAGAAVGSTGPYLTVGSYPLPNGYTVTRGIGREPGAVGKQLPGGGYAVYRSSRPESVYLAWPKLDYQVEVYSPTPDEARRLAYSAQLRPLAG